MTDPLIELTERYEEAMKLLQRVNTCPQPIALGILADIAEFLDPSLKERIAGKDRQ